MCYQVILCTYIPTQMRVCIWMICKANCYLGKALHKKDNVMDNTKTSHWCYSAVILRLYGPVVSSIPYKEHFTWKPAANDHHKMRVHVSRDFKVYIKWLRQYNGIYNYLVKKTKLLPWHYQRNPKYKESLNEIQKCRDHAQRRMCLKGIPRILFIGNDGCNYLIVPSYIFRCLVSKLLLTLNSKEFCA